MVVMRAFICWLDYSGNGALPPSCARRWDFINNFAPGQEVYIGAKQEWATEEYGRHEWFFRLRTNVVLE